MKSRAASTLVLIVIGVLIALGLGYTGAPPPADPPEVALDSTTASEVAAAPAATADSEQPPMQDYAAACFRVLRERNPRGRIVRLAANRLADRCSIIVETDEGSGRWLFDWHDYQGDYKHEGELRWPEAWPDELPAAGIDAAEFAPERLNALMDESRAIWPEDQRNDWLYEIIWLPAPFARPLAYISFDDLSDDNRTDTVLTVIFDGATRLADADYEQAYALYPFTRFELREDHNFKGPLFESTALTESAVSLEGDPDAGPAHPLAASIESCMYWLHTVNTGKRVLRVGIDAGHCFLVLENGGVRDDYYLFEASGSENFTERASLILDPVPTPNLLLDRSRLSAARVRERLQQATAAGAAGYAIERVAIAWLDGAMLWQFDGSGGGARLLVYLDESGSVIQAPDQFPVSVHERELGFADTRPAMPFVSEAL